MVGETEVSYRWRGGGVRCAARTRQELRLGRAEVRAHGHSNVFFGN